MHRFAIRIAITCCALQSAIPACGSAAELTSNLLQRCGAPAPIRVIIEFDKRAKHAEALESAGRGGLSRFSMIDETTMVFRAVGCGEVVSLAKAPGVTAIVEDEQLGPLLARDETPTTNGFDVRDLPEVWQHGSDGTGVTVAIVDGGLSASSPSLKDKVLREGCFLVGNLGDPGVCVKGDSLPTGEIVEIFSDAARCTNVNSIACSHATNIAGVIAARTMGGRTGVAPGASIVVARVMSDEGSAYLSSMLRGLTWIQSLVETYAATGQGPNIVAVNLSAGSQEPTGNGYCDAAQLTQLIAKRIASFRAAGIAVFASAGNDGSATIVNTPACARGAIPVGSTDENQAIAEFSSRNSRTIFARGTNVSVLMPDVIFRRPGERRLRSLEGSVSKPRGGFFGASLTPFHQIYK